MIKGHYKTTVSLDNMLDNSSTVRSDSKKSRKTRKKNRWQPYTVPSRRTFSKHDIKWQPYTSKKWPSDSFGRLERLAEKGVIPIVSSNFSRHVDSTAAQREYPELETAIGITNLPDELIVKILSNLDIRDISVCKRVNRSWQEIVDTNYLQALSFSRRLRFRPIAQTVNNFHSFTRGWLTGFNNRGKELAKQLDKFLDNKHFPEILFFNIAELLTKTKRLTCRNVYTAHHPEFVYNDPILSANGNCIVTASDDYTAKIWELVAGQLEHKATFSHNHWLFNVSLSPDGSHLVTASSGLTAEIWGLVVDGQWQHKATIRHSGRVRSTSFSPDGSHIVTASDDETAKIWEIVAEQWQEKATIEVSGRVGSASFSPDGNYIVTASVTASGDHTAKIWGLVAGLWRHKATIEHSDRVDNASFSPDGNHIVTTSISDDYIDKTIKIWERVAAGQWQEKATSKYTGLVREISFSPDGSHLVTALDPGTAKIWELVAGQWREKANIPFSGSISKASFSPDGSHLVTTTSHDNAIIWGLVGGQWKRKATFRYVNRVRSASFSSDGIHFLTLSGDNVTKIWLLASC